MKGDREMEGVREMEERDVGRERLQQRERDCDRERDGEREMGGVWDVGERDLGKVKWMGTEMYGEREIGEREMDGVRDEEEISGREKWERERKRSLSSSPWCGIRNSFPSVVYSSNDSHLSPRSV